MEGSEVNSVVYPMPVESELHFMVGEMTTDVSCELMTGFAECLGSELEKNKVYAFPPSSSVVIFSWQGCTIKVTGKTEMANVTTDTLMIITVNLHACLEELRIKAQSQNSRGPVSLIVGPTDVGKSSLSRILLNYAARLGRKPLYIDLDVGQSSASIPGTISVLPIDKPSDICEGFNKQASIVYPFGYKSPGHNIALYFLLVKKLGQLVLSRLKNANPNTFNSGIVIDTCGWVRGAGYQAITLAACAFEIDVLFVIEEEKLYLQLKKDMPSNVQVVYVYKQYGINERSRDVRSRNRDISVWKYFHGSKNLNSHSINVKFHKIQIIKVNPKFEDSEVDSHNVTFDYVEIVPVNIGPNLVSQVLGLSLAENVDENIIATNMIYFVCIVNVDMEREILTLLLPQPGPLPRSILLLGDIRLKNMSPWV